MVTMKTAWVAGTATASLALAVLLGVTGLHIAAQLTTVIAVHAAAAGIAGPLVRHTRHIDDEHYPERRQTILGMARAAIGLRCVWALVALMQPAYWAAWGLVLLVLALAEWWLSRTTEHVHESRVQRERAAAEQAAVAQQQAALAAPAAAPAPQDKALWLMEETLRRGGFTGVTVESYEPIVAGGQTIGIRYLVNADAAKGKGAGEQLDAGKRKEIAINFGKVAGTKLMLSSVHVMEQKVAGDYTISITEGDPFTTMYPYRDPIGPDGNVLPTSIDEPALIGYRIDGTEFRQPLALHWADTGKTRSGKSSLIQVKLAHITRCEDAVLVVAGTEKLYDLIGPWIEPYLGKGMRLPFVVAAGAQDTADIMAELFLLGRWRQSPAAPHSTRGAHKKVFLLIDEFSFFAVLTQYLADYGPDGKKTPSEGAEALTKGVGGAEVWLHAAAQRGTNNNWGEKGGDISNNFGVQTVFNVGDPMEVGRAMGDFKIPVPENKGEFLIRATEGGQVERLKAPYINETDPKKRKPDHDGPDISEVAWARHVFDHQLDPDSYAAVGPLYKRLAAMDADEVLAYLGSGKSIREQTAPAKPALRSVPDPVVPDEPGESVDADEVDPLEGKSEAFKASYLAVMAEYADVLDAHTEDTAAEQPAATPAHDQRTQKERVLDYVREHGPTSPSAIHQALNEEGRPITKQVVTNALTDLRSTGQVTQPRPGVWAAENAA